MIEFIDYLAKICGISKYFARFLCTGIINTAFGYVALAFFIFLGLNDFLAPLFATIAGIIFNFNTIGGFVFGSRAKKLFWKFCAVYFVTYVLYVIGLKFFDYIGITNRYISALILTMPIALVSYFLNKGLVFRSCIKK